MTVNKIEYLGVIFNEKMNMNNDVKNVVSRVRYLLNVFYISSTNV